MKFLLDENIPARLRTFLKRLGYSSSHISELNPGLDDAEVLEFAVKSEDVLVTFDKDFGGLVFKQRLNHRGIVLLRLEDQTFYNTAKAVDELLTKHSKRIENNFIVVTEQDEGFKIRISNHFKTV